MTAGGAAGLDGPASDAMLKLGRFFTKWDQTDDGRAVFREGGRKGDIFYRDRWSLDKVGVAVLAWVVNLQPDGEVPAGLTFVAMAAALGLGTGGVFAWVGVLVVTALAALAFTIFAVRAGRKPKSRPPSRCSGFQPKARCATVKMASPARAPTTVPLIRMNCRSLPIWSSIFCEVSSASQRATVSVITPAMSERYVLTR